MTHPFETYHRDSNFYLRILYFFVLSFWLLNSSYTLAEASTDPIGDQLCVVVKTLSGSTAKAVAIVALMSVGIGLFMGKVNWGVALTTACGVIVIFGAGSIVGFLGGSSVTGGADCAAPKSGT